MREANALLIVCLAAAAIANILLPIGLAFYGVRKLACRWRFILLGLCEMLLVQVCEVILALGLIPLGPTMERFIEPALRSWLGTAAAALVAGLFEETGRWLAIRFFVAGPWRRWPTAVSLGIGHGGLESAMVGLAGLAALGAYLLTLLPPEAVPALAAHREQLQHEFAQLAGWEPLLGIWERISALAIQVALSVVVLQAFLRGARWWWFAVAAHAMVDFTALGLRQALVSWWGSTPALVAVEVLCTAYAIAALLIIYRLGAADRSDAAILAASPHKSDVVLVDPVQIREHAGDGGAPPHSADG